MPPGLSPMHLLVIFVVALNVLGPDKMPDAVRKGARLLGEARQWSARISEELQSVVSMQTRT
ncbi:MAG: twin-arginine translocase TatA/TatE family subunit [Actinomycetota bacterium]|nr:twin-arginine translocase TatA/TatE family subunit [Actinomycetota bacterium]